jgi:hypothetical protein
VRLRTMSKSAVVVSRSHRTRSAVLRVVVVAAIAGLVALSSNAAGEEQVRSQLEMPTSFDLRFATGRSIHGTGVPLDDRNDEPDPRPVPTRRSRAASGAEVSIGVSPSYSFDAARIQAWVDFIGSLLHGSELETVSFYIAPPSEIGEFCGPHAAACYWASGTPPLIVAPGEDAPGGFTAEAILAHEYGHHVSNSRANPPWGALFYGTKRWASYVDVCAAVVAGQFFPGDGGERYGLNPTEGFAEAYRVANQHRLGVPEAPWRLVDEVFYPDATASELIEQDVLDPWTAHTSVTYRGRFTRTGPTRLTFDVSTALDGVATARIRAPKGARFRLTESLSTVCGQRTTYFTVRRLKGFGRFELVVSRP